MTYHLNQNLLESVTLMIISINPSSNPNLDGPLDHLIMSIMELPCTQTDRYFPVGDPDPPPSLPLSWVLIQISRI